MTNNLEKRILEKIKKEKIKPIPRWFFILKNSFFLSMLGFSVLIGSLAFSVLFYIFSDNSFYFFDKFDFEKVKTIIIFWILILIIFLFFAIKNYRKTQKAYRYPLSWIIIFNISFSFFFGYIFYFTGIPQRADEFSAKHLDFYQKNVKISEIKKEIFLKKLKEIGITKEILEKHPELKIKIEEKFNEKVLGERILDKNKNCEKEKISCYQNELPFKNEKGCGCKKIYH